MSLSVSLSAPVSFLLPSTPLHLYPSACLPILFRLRMLVHLTLFLFSLSVHLPHCLCLCVTQSVPHTLTTHPLFLSVFIPLPTPPSFLSVLSLFLFLCSLCVCLSPSQSVCLSCSPPSPTPIPIKVCSTDIAFLSSFIRLASLSCPMLVPSLLNFWMTKMLRLKNCASSC